MKLIVDISDAKASSNPDDVLITYSLGSCIGAVLYDPVTKVGGMLHYQLPSSRSSVETSKKNPLMFADTGMDYLLGRMAALSADKKRMKVKIIGGAQMMDNAKVFQIGKRNYAAIRQYLWKKGMFIDAQDVGGKNARTVLLRIADGAVRVKTQGQNKEL